VNPGFTQSRTIMKNEQQKSDLSQGTSQDAAIEAALSIFRDKGLSAISFRSVGEKAGIHPATLQFRFGTKRELLDGVFSLLADQEAERAQQIEKLANRATKPPSAGTHLYQLTLCGGEPERGRNLILFEMLIAAIRDPAIRPHADKWLSETQHSWTAAFSPSDNADDFGWFLTELQIGLLVSGIGSGRPRETALVNAEIVDRAFGRLLPEDAAWFSAFFDEVLKHKPTAPGGAGKANDLSERLLTAGAEIVATQGADALSFRNVAHRAGTTPSATQNAFPKRQDLINAVYDRIYQNIAYPFTPIDSFRDASGTAAYFVDVILNRQFAGAYLGLSFAELYLAAARHPTLCDLAWYMRMTRGNVIDDTNRNTHVARGVSFDLHAVALWAFGCTLVHASREPEAKLRDVLEKRVEFGLARLWPHI
jgi:AcrR family transcriptional regulator